MTSSTTVKAVTNGTGTSTETKETEREHGVAVLRDKEAKALISLACDALSETFDVNHEMHGLIYGKDDSVPDAQIQRTLEEALTCLQTADHYLRMLGSVLDERTGHGPGTWPDPAF
jgi:hypothetical protein